MPAFNLQTRWRLPVVGMQRYLHASKYFIATDGYTMPDQDERLYIHASAAPGSANVACMDTTHHLSYSNRTSAR
jgi:hypothetical protein